LSLRQLQVTVPRGQGTACKDVLDRKGVLSATLLQASGSDGHDLVVANLHLGLTEELIDELEARFDFESPGTGIIVLLPVEAAVHDSDDQEHEAPDRAAREELEEVLEDASVLDQKFLLLAALSAVVAAFGLLMDDAAVVVGAMVIAPLLGPIVAFSFGVVTADERMIRRGLQAEVVGLLLSIFIATAIGALVRGFPITVSEQVGLRTSPNLFNVALALAAGSAGALSITTGLERALVGVMVAVALLPPASVLGLGLGRMDATVVRGSALLLVTNIVSIVLAGVLTFHLSGLRPGEWWRRRRASLSVMRVGAAAAGLLVLVALTLVPATAASLREMRATGQLLRSIEAWSPGYLEVDRLSLDLRRDTPRVNIELRTTRPPDAVDVAGLYELVSNVVPNPVVHLELSEVRFVELRRRTASRLLSGR